MLENRRPGSPSLTPSPEKPAPLTEPFVANPFGEQYLHAVNRGAFAHVGAQAMFQRHFGERLAAPDTLNIVIGTDSGLLIEHLLQAGLPEGSRFLFVELPEVLPRVRERLGQRLAHPGIALEAADSWHARAAEFAIDSYVYLDSVRLWKSLAASDAFLPAYRLLHQAVEMDLNTWTWSLRSELETSTFANCQLANVADALCPAILLRDRYRGRTAVVLGGGPSLDELLPWILAHRERLVLIAVSRISRRLQALGVVPDIVCTIDPTELSFDVSREMLRFGPEVVLATAYHANPPLVGQWQGPRLHLGPRLPWRSALNEDNIPVTGPTVTNTALHLAVEMGFSRVILAGVDLCFADDGNSHAAGSNERSAGPLLGHMGPRVPRNDGTLAETTEAFQQAVDSIGRQAEGARDRNCSIINPAPQAARIPHVEHRPLSDLEPDGPPPAPVATLLSGDGAAEGQLWHQYWTRTEAELRETLRDLDRIESLAREALRCNERLFGAGGPTRNFRYKRRMDKIERRLEREHGDLARLVKHYGVRLFLRAIRTHDDWTDEEIRETGDIYYRSYLEGTERLRESVTLALDKVRLRRCERDPETDLARLAEGWRSHGEPGRVRLWVDWQPDRAADPANAGLIDALQAEFEQALTRKDTRHERRCRAEADLSGVPSKALWLFQHHDRDGLSRLVSALAAHPEPAARPIHHLAAGYLAELEQRIEEALESYQQIQEPPLVEEALRRITALSLAREDYASALLALECLTQISPAYLLQFAELLRILGQSQQAAEAYSRHLEQAPGDHAALLKLGQLYREQGILDGARWAFGHVLEQDPDNRAARRMLDELASSEQA